MKKSILITLTVLINISVFSKNDSLKTALILVDIQEFYFPGGFSELVKPEEASLNAKKILQEFRKNNQLVVHVKHKSKKQDAIHENVKPLEEEKVITKHQVNSFHETTLKAYLDSNKIKQLVIVGMQTHMCVEGAVRAAHDYGYKVIVVSDACATKNLKFGANEIKADDVHLSSLASFRPYAKVLTANDFLNSFF